MILQRIMLQHGISYTFEHHEDKHILKAYDSSYLGVKDQGKLLYQPSKPDSGGHIHSFKSKKSIACGAYTRASVLGLVYFESQNSILKASNLLSKIPSKTITSIHQKL